MSSVPSPRPTNYLEQFDAAAPADRFPMVRRWIDNEPLPFFKELRENRPILVTPLCTLVAFFDDCIEVLNMPKIFTAALYLPKWRAEFISWRMTMTRCTRAKNPSCRPCSTVTIFPRSAPWWRKSPKTCLIPPRDRWTPSVVTAAWSRPRWLQDYFGLTGVDRKDLIDWSYRNQANTFYNQPFDLIPDEKRKAIQAAQDEASKKLTTYLTEMILTRWLAVKAEQAGHVLLAPWYLLRLLVRKLLGKGDGKLEDNIVTRMVRTAYPGAVEFDIKRLAINAGGLLIGAIETTSQAVSQVIQYLLDNPQWLAKAQSAAQSDNPAAFDGIVWEALRFVPISSFIFRQTASEYTIAKGTAMPPRCSPEATCWR